MISIKIVCVGNLKEKFWRDASIEYEKRLSKFCKLKIVEIVEQNKYTEIEKIKELEGIKIIEQRATISGDKISEYFVDLDICFSIDLNRKDNKDA